MTPSIDYHMHTPLCGHAKGEPKEYVEHAIKIGLKEIGFSDHAPLVSHRDPTITMDFNEMPTYYAMIEDVQKKYPQITIKLGLEADFIPGYEHKTKEILAAYPYDYVIGSVHFIGQWGFDDPGQRDGWKSQDINQVYRDYYALLRQSAQTRIFDIMGHVDLVKKFGHRPTEDMSQEIQKTAKVFKECGVAVEINSSGLRKPVAEMYPAQSALQIYCDAGVPLTFGSDAHVPTDVGRDFDKAIALAKAVGYKEHLVFRKRKIEKILKF